MADDPIQLLRDEVACTEVAREELTSKVVAFRPKHDVADAQ